MSRTQPIRASVAAATLVLAFFSTHSFADPNQGDQGPGTPGQGDQGPGESGPPADGPGTSNADGNRDWTLYWLEYISGLDRPEWAHEHAGGNGGENGAGGTGP